MPIPSINLVSNKALWGLRSQISLVRLYQYQNDFTGKSIPKNIQLIYTRRRSFWVVILVRYKVQARIWCREELTVILPLCLCSSIGRCISKTGHLGTNKHSNRPMSSWNSASFLIHLFISAPPSTSAEDKTHFGFQLQQLFSFRSNSLKLSAKSWVHVRCLPLGHPNYHSMRWQHA